jgi:hypothetical protein
MPEALLGASLSPRVRCDVSACKAPPHTLVLAGASFSPFATAYGAASAAEAAAAAAATAAAAAGAGAGAAAAEEGAGGGGVARWSGGRLELRARGLARQARWRREALGPAVEALLLHDDWRAWAEEELPRLSWPGAEEVARRDAEWQASEQRRKAERQDERARRAAVQDKAAGGGGTLLGWLRGLLSPFAGRKGSA